MFSFLPAASRKERNPAYHHLFAVKCKTTSQMPLIRMELGEFPDDQRAKRLVIALSSNQHPKYFDDSGSLGLPKQPS